MKKIIITVTILIILGVGAWYLWGYMSAADLVVEEESNPLSEEVVQQPETKSFVVEAKNFSLSPATITVKEGDTVSITLKNMGGTHDLKIDEYNVATKQTSNGQEETVSFVADKAGNFEYYCSVGTHRALGVKGMLIVEE